LDGKPVKSKTPGLIQKLDKDDVAGFVKGLLKNPFLKNFIEYHYDLELWGKLEKMLKSHL
jgi:hypothetical protein